MSELLFNIPLDFGPNETHAYFDGAAAAIRLYAVWQDGEQFVGMGRPLQAALDDLEEMRETALKKFEEENQA